jgi:hypothetical protein
MYQKGNKILGKSTEFWEKRLVVKHLDFEKNCIGICEVKSLIFEDNFFFNF